MKYLNKYNESDSVERFANKFFALLGFDVSEDGIVTSKTKLSNFICRMLVRDGEFVKISDNKYTMK